MLRVIVVGMGPIGLACAVAIGRDRELALAGMVDVDASKAGKSLAELGREAGQDAGAIEPEAVKVTESIDAALASGPADVAVVTTSSDFADVAPTLREALGHRLAVVSSCEAMVWPWYRHAALAEVLDAEAVQAGRALLGTGVNPGFAMDTLAVALAAMVRRVTAVRCERRVEAGLRRQPLQAKVGATLTLEQFRQLQEQKKIGHAGLAESAALLAAGLGRRVEPGSVEETLEAVLAEKPTPSAVGLIRAGDVAGIHNVARWSGPGLRLELDLWMVVGLGDPRDTVTLDGPVQLKLKIPGGLPGDSATVAALLNHVRVVHEARPGLRTMLDVPLAGCRGRD